MVVQCYKHPDRSACHERDRLPSGARLGYLRWLLLHCINLARVLVWDRENTTCTRVFQWLASSTSHFSFITPITRWLKLEA